MALFALLGVLRGFAPATCEKAGGVQTYASMSRVRGPQTFVCHAIAFYGRRRMRPEIPIMLCTGYSELINEEKAKRNGIRAFVMKPVVLNEIANAVRMVLDQEKG